MVVLRQRKINILSDIFGLKFTEDEISQSADKLAEERLDDGQFEYYLSLAISVIGTALYRAYNINQP